MDRRTFSKTLAALFAAPAVLAEQPASAASVQPVYGPLPSYKEKVLGHYGFTNMEMTTTYNLEPIFGIGQLSADDPFGLKDPVIDVSFSFYPESDHKVERTVYLQGVKKEWVALVEKNEAAKAYKKMSEESQVPAIDDSNQRKFYAASDVKFFDPDTHERVPAKCVEKDKFYTVHVNMGEDFNNFVCRVILTNFKAIDIQEFNVNDEVDIQPQKC